MWIRSQNKEQLVNCKNVGFKEFKDEKRDDDIHSKKYRRVISSKSTFFIQEKDKYNYQNVIILGKYKSKKRCIEVLDEIEKHQNAYYINHIVYQMPDK